MNSKDKQADRERLETMKAMQAEQTRKFWAAMGNDLIAYLERENAQLKSELERLRADRDRLNAIRDNLWQIQFNSRILNAALLKELDNERWLRAEPGYSGANVAGLMYLEDELLKARRTLLEVQQSHAKLEQAMRDSAATLRMALLALGDGRRLRAEKVLKDALEGEELSHGV